MELELDKVERHQWGITWPNTSTTRTTKEIEYLGLMYDCAIMEFREKGIVLSSFNLLNLFFPKQMYDNIDSSSTIISRNDILRLLGTYLLQRSFHMSMGKNGIT